MKHFILFLALLALSCGSDDCDCPAQSTTIPTNTNGSLVFWTPHVPEHGGLIRININGVESVTNIPYATQPPNCLSNQGCAFFSLPGGTYNYSTIDYFGFTSSGTVTVIGGQCNKKYIE